MAKHHEIVLYQGSDETGWDVEKIKNVINAHASIKIYAIMLHDKDTDEEGNPLKPHFHVYLNYGKTSVQETDVAKWFGVAKNAVERIRGNRYTVLKYYLHDGFPDKYPYPVEDMIANFNVEDFFAREKQHGRDEEIIKDCASGIITRYNYQDHVTAPVYARLKVKMDRAWEYADHAYLIQQDGERACDVLWLHGESGTGKTTLGKLLAKEQGKPVYVTATGKDPFSHYAQQPAIIIDDVRPGEQFEYYELLKLLDPNYQCPIHSRYTNVVLRADLIVITSVMSPRIYWDQCELPDSDSVEQLLRRLTEIWWVSEKEISISKQTATSSNLLGKRKNPVPDYLAIRNLGNGLPTFNGSAMLDAIGRKCQMQTAVLND